MGMTCLSSPLFPPPLYRLLFPFSLMFTSCPSVILAGSNSFVHRRSIETFQHLLQHLVFKM